MVNVFECAVYGGDTGDVGPRSVLVFVQTWKKCFYCNFFYLIALLTLETCCASNSEAI